MEWSQKWFEGYKGTLRGGVSLKACSYLRIGGSAALFLEPWAEEDAAVAVRVCLEHDLPIRVLGAGSNLLIPDDAVEAAVFHLPHWNRVVRDGDQLIVQAGKSLPSLIRMAKECRLAGLESLCGIPAQIGGAVAMNAGTSEGEIFDFVVSVRFIDQHGELRELGRSEIEPSYRDGGLGDVLITSVTFALEPGAEDKIFERMRALLKRRTQTQPVSECSVGCIFKNPEGDSAGRLIQAAGLKGERVGAIEVSTKHANFFVNTGEGTYAQVRELIERVRSSVQSHCGHTLALEVRDWCQD